MSRLITLFALLCLASTIFTIHLKKVNEVKLGNDTREQKEPETESEISWDKFQEYFRNSSYNKFFVFPIVRKYYKDDPDLNLTRKKFIELARDYLVEDFHQFGLSITTLAKSLDLLTTAMKKHFAQQHADSFSLRDCYRYTVQGYFGNILKQHVHFDELPVELRHRIDEMEEKREDKRRDPREERGFQREKKKPKDFYSLKKEELKKKQRERYFRYEWDLDGRRVVDEDYDDLEPSYQRNLHKSKMKEFNMSEEEIDELLNLDL